MEPAELNGGRFYLRPLHDDDRIDDRPILKSVLGDDYQDSYVADARDDWHADRRYTWAVCEATCIDAAALVTLTKTDPDTAKVSALPLGDPNEVLDNPDDLVPKTRQDAADEGLATVTRWAAGHLGLTVD